MKEKWGEDFAETAREVTEYGCAMGFPGLTLYRDTVAFYKGHAEEIWEIASNLADDLLETPLAMIAGFTGAKYVDDHDTFANLLTWFAVEEVCRFEVELGEED